VHVTGSKRHFRVTNDVGGVAELVRRLGGGSAIRVVMEASGGYERVAHHELVAQGRGDGDREPEAGARLSPEAMGLEAKTDRVDAKVIARYGQVTDPRATPVLPPERQELAELLACRKQLIDEITVRKQQLEHLQGDRPRAMVVEMIAYFTSKNKELDKAIDAHVAAHDELQATVDLLTTMRGCGRILALTLITDLPELGQLDRRQVAALVGLAHPSPKTAASERTSASPKAAEARSARSPTWPPSAPSAPTTTPSRPATRPSSPAANPKSSPSSPSCAP
jgi:transposase